MQEAMAKVAQQQKKLNEEASRLPADAVAEGRWNRPTRRWTRRSRPWSTTMPNRRSRSKTRRPTPCNSWPSSCRPRRRTPPKPQTGDAQAPHGLPNKEQTDQARDLAKEQRDLRDSAPPRRGPRRRRRAEGQPARRPGEAAAGSGEAGGRVAQEAAQSSGKDSPAAHEAGQAQQRPRQAANKMQAGALQAGRRPASRRPSRCTSWPSRLAQTPGDPNAPAQAAKAEQLAAKQDEINRKLDPLADDPAAQRAKQEPSSRTCKSRPAS